MWGLLSLFTSVRGANNSGSGGSGRGDDGASTTARLHRKTSVIDPALFTAVAATGSGGSGGSGGVSSGGGAPSINDFRVIKPISAGGYGKVFLAQKKATGDIFAIKAIFKSSLLRKNLVKQALTERNVMAASDNPFVVKLYYAFESETKLYFVMEFCIGGDCGSLLKAWGVFDADTTKRYISEAVLALGYLHSLGCIHRDFKPENMLINAEGHIVLTDFGLSETGVITNTGRERAQHVVVVPPTPVRSSVVSPHSSTGSLTPLMSKRQQQQRLHSSQRVSLDTTAQQRSTAASNTIVVATCAGGERRWYER